MLDFVKGIYYFDPERERIMNDRKKDVHGLPTQLSTYPLTLEDLRAGRFPGAQSASGIGAPLAASPSLNALNSASALNTGLNALNSASPLSSMKISNSARMSSATVRAGNDVVVSSVRDLGQLVQVARTQMKLNQQRFADLAGVGRRFISELENGKV